MGADTPVLLTHTLTSGVLKARVVSSMLTGIRLSTIPTSNPGVTFWRGCQFGSEILRVEGRDKGRNLNCLDAVSLASA